jgi:membrane fusion protein (multidrug efflux system)
MDNGHPAAGRPASPAASLIRKAFAAFVLLAAVVGAFLYWRAADHAPHAVQGQAPRGPAPVHVLRLAAQTIPIEPVYLGQTEAAQTVEIRARVNGFLDRRTFIEGSIVSPGQQLFQIDPRSFKADLDIAKAGLANYEAVLTRAHHQVKRYEKLATTGAATANDLEEWQTEELVAQSNIELQKAKIAQAELDLSYTNIASPITGRIGEAQKDVGSYVNASSDGLLAEVEQIDPIYVRFTVSEQDLLRWQRQIESGEIVSPGLGKLGLAVTLADGTEYPHPGSMNYVGVRVDTNTGSAVMRGTVKNPDGRLLPGQFVNVRVNGMTRPDSLLVPQTAVLQSPAGAMVYVVNTANQAELKPVTLGAWRGDMMIVESGLTPGDQVITDRLMQLRPGAPVQVLEDAPATAPQAAPAGAEK